MCPINTDVPHPLGLIYDDDAYVEIEARRDPTSDGRAAGLMGRQVAGQSFLGALLRHGTWTDLAVLARHPGAERSLERACRENPSERPRRLHLFDESRLLDDPRGLPPARLLHMPSPLDSRHAWARQSMGASSFSLTGVTHTLCAAEAVRQLCDMVTAPFEAHDALICTSSAVVRMVRTVTDDYAAYLRDRHGGSPSVRVRLETIPLGVDLDRFRPATPEERADWRSRLRVGDDEMAVLFVGRLAHHAKAHPFPMFRACDLAARSSGRSIHLILAGWAPHRAMLDAFIEGARTFAPGVKVTLLDGMNADVRFGVWKAADVAVSLADNLQETFGLVVVEAMASGLPVVATDWDGYRDLVEHEITGLLVPTAMVAGATTGTTARLLYGAIGYDQFLAETSQSISVDVTAAAAAIGRLAADESYRRELGAAGRARAVENYAWPVIIARYESLWREQESIRESLAATAPITHPPAIYPPPDRSFAGYPSRWILGDPQEVAATERAASDLALFLDLPLTHHAAEARIGDAGLIRKALAAASPRCSVARLDDLFASAGVDSGRARATLAWLLKYDLLRLVDRPGTE
ncbi:glycosyltransferase family 4 protein [Aquisphaera insulae]|uniref:glycosyltransferase family 4 protein n=1 Tax=Aquisphaera insulae TaxID=2712864 RepID=UPI0013E9D380|nr:glycosyltransferase family 4 protein [Aquisphaera insulae]